MSKDLFSFKKEDIQLNKSSQIKIKSFSYQDIAIIGIGARLPMCQDLDEFWSLLKEGYDFIHYPGDIRKKDIIGYHTYKNTDLNENVMFEGAFLKEIDKFDHQFFNISYKEACLWDPYHRIFLETAWHAFEDAGYTKEMVWGSPTGVYVGRPTESGYYDIVKDIEPEYDFMALAGNIPAIISSRISYVLDLKGPNMMVDTSCSSSLTAVHLACKSLRNGECDMALVGGINIILNPIHSKQKPKPDIMSSSGRAKAFDNNADGTAIGEGSIAILLKPLEKAVYDKNPIYAVIKGSACNQDGHSIGITAPNALAQKEVMIKSWEDAKINPEKITFIEAHGTGTKLGDPIEIQGLTEAFQQYTHKRQFAAIGSIKTNIGHLDSCAGIAGLLKAVLCLKYKEIPPIVHLKEPNNNINFKKSPVYLNDKVKEWEVGENESRICGVSSFGLSGTNCHVVLEEYKQNIHEPIWNIENESSDQLFLFCISAKTEEALKEYAHQYDRYLESSKNVALGDICYSASMGRTHYSVRLAIIVNNIEELKESIKAALKTDFKSNHNNRYIYFGSFKVVYHNVTNISENEYTTDQILEESVKINDQIDKFKSVEERKSLLENVAKSYIKGADIQWEKIYQQDKRDFIRIPLYPFEKKRCWITIPAKKEKDEMDKPERKNQKEEIKDHFRNFIALAFDIDIKNIDDQSDFFELGIDSISIIQLKQEIQKQYGLDIPVEQLFQSITNIGLLGDYINETIPETHDEKQENTLYTGKNDSHRKFERTCEKEQGCQEKNLNTDSMDSDYLSSNEGILHEERLENLFNTQLNIIKKQLEILEGVSGKQLNPVENKNQPILSTKKSLKTVNHEKPDFFFRRFIVKKDEQLDDRQQLFYKEFMKKYVEKTKKSKEAAENYRKIWSNDRLIQGYSHQWKDLMYPIFINSAEGSKIWDLDGNQYIDFSMGFGSILLGYNHPTIQEAVIEAAKDQIIIGPMTTYAGEVAGLVTELTGAERVAFCNSGTEAVMWAVRIARAYKNKEKIVLFTGSFHGTFDGVIMQRDYTDHNMRSMPISLGTPYSYSDHVMVLEYDDPKSLEIIKNQADQIGAVIVEPVQSRRPQLQPHGFLKELRSITQDHEIVLIFDEVITGFRLGLDGAQGYFDVKADIITYGKIAGGGMPIGIVAGKEKFIKFIDGGVWSFYDDSSPDANLIVSGGTFSCHPVSIAASKAVLNFIKLKGTDLYEELNNRTKNLARNLNDYFTKNNIPIEIVYCTSMFSFKPKKDVGFLRFLFYKLIEKGIYLWEGATCFLSYAHSDEDIDCFIKAIQQSCYELAKAGCFNLEISYFDDENLCQKEIIKQQENPQLILEEHIPLTDEQLRMWLLVQQNPKESVSFHENMLIPIDGKIDIEVMKKAFDELINRHDILRTYKIDGQFIYIKKHSSLEIPLVSFAELSQEKKRKDLIDWIRDKNNEVINLENEIPFKPFIIKLDERKHIIFCIVHHIIADGWSINILQEELIKIYLNKTKNITFKLSYPKQFKEYVSWLHERYESKEGMEAAAFWKEKFTRQISELNFASAALLSGDDQTGGYISITIDDNFHYLLKEYSKQNNVTLFITLLAAFNVFLHKISGQEKIAIHIPFSGQLKAECENLVGHCVNMLPLFLDINEDLTFKEFLGYVKEEYFHIKKNQVFSMKNIIDSMNKEGIQYNIPKVSVVFNMDQNLSGVVDFQDFRIDSDFLNYDYHDKNKYDLFMDVLQEKEKLHLRFEYNKSLFSQEIINEWGTYLKELLRLIINNSEQMLCNIEL